MLKSRGAATTQKSQATPGRQTRISGEGETRRHGEAVKRRRGANGRGESGHGEGEKRRRGESSEKNHPANERVSDPTHARVPASPPPRVGSSRVPASILSFLQSGWDKIFSETVVSVSSSPSLPVDMAISLITTFDPDKGHS